MGHGSNIEPHNVCTREKHHSYHFQKATVSRIKTDAMFLTMAGESIQIRCRKQMNKWNKKKNSKSRTTTLLSDPKIKP